MRPFASRIMVVAILAWHSSLYAGTLGNNDKLVMVYSDESHCLVEPEIRGESDKPNSCYCRDAIVDARYVYQNYVIMGKDRNDKEYSFKIHHYISLKRGEILRIETEQPVPVDRRGGLTKIVIEDITF